MRVRSVNLVRVEILKSSPPQLHIVVSGTVSTGGWSDIRLDPAASIDLATLAFDFVGTPPTGPAIEVITQVNAETTIPWGMPLPSAVLVNAATNSIAQPVGDVSPTLCDGMGLQGPPSGYHEMPGVAQYRAVRLGSDLHIRASGDLGYLTDIADLRQLPIRIYPPQFGFFIYRPGIGLPATRTFNFVSRFLFPPDVGEVIIHDMAGMHTVPIHDPSIAPAMLAEGSTAATATGYGDSLQAAFDHAVAQLPPQPMPDAADILIRYSITSSGKLKGGFVGFDTYFAEVERNP